MIIPDECIITNMDNDAEKENKPHPNLVGLAKKEIMFGKDLDPTVRILAYY